MRTSRRPALRLGPEVSTVASSAALPTAASRNRSEALQTANASSASVVAADVAVGITFGLLAGSNLVQGAWLQDYPWLNLTTAAFVLALPICLTGLRRRTTISAALLILLLMFGIALGYLEPALSDTAGQKRVNVVIGVVFVFIASYLSLSNRRRLKWFFVTLVCLAFPVVVGQIFAPDPLALATGRRTPVGLNAIGAGRAIGSALVLVLTMLVIAWKGKRRLPLTVLALVLGVSLYLDGSRGPVVGVLVAIIVLVWKHPKLRPIPKLALFVTLGCLTALAYQRAVATASRLGELTTSGRYELYRQAIHIAVAHPLGIGWGNFYRFAPVGLVGADQSDNLYAHNSILEFWIEAGVLGAVAFATVSIMVLAKAFRLAGRSAGGLALSALLVNLLAGAMVSSDIIGNRMMWVVLGAVLAAEVSAGVRGLPHREPMTGPGRARGRGGQYP